MNIQEAINFISYVVNNDNPKVETLVQQFMENSEPYSIGDLMLVKVRGLAINGAITFYLEDKNVLQIDNESNIETDYVLCTSIDAIGINEGALTVEGFIFYK